METPSTEENDAISDTYNLKHSPSGNTATDQSQMHNGDVKYKPIFNGPVYALALPPSETEKRAQESIKQLGKQIEQVAETIAAIGGMGHDSQPLTQRQGQESGYPVPSHSTGHGHSAHPAAVAASGGGRTAQSANRPTVSVGHQTLILSVSDGERVRRLEKIVGFLIAIGDCRTDHTDNRDLDQFWQAISQYERALRRAEIVFRDPRLCETIKCLIPSDPGNILDKISQHAQGTYKLLIGRSVKVSPNRKRESDGISKPPTKSRSSRPSRRSSEGIPKTVGIPKISPNRPAKPRFSSDSQVPITKKEKALIRTSTPVNMKGLRVEFHSLQDSIQRLSMVCERIYVLRDLQNAHRAYTMLHQCLSNCCGEHDTHIIDFDLETSARDPNGSTEGRFRFAVPRTETRRGEEVWLAFKARDSFDFIDGPAHHQNPLKCPLNFAVDPTGFTNPEAVLQLSYIPQQETQKLQTAATIARTPAEGSLGQLTHYLVPYKVGEVDIVRLAKQIAIAVLRFNYTPWVSAFWGADDVVLFSETDNPSNLSLRRPHFRIRLAAAPPAQLEVTGFYGSRIQSTVFCLGVVLYELWKYFPQDHETDMYNPHLGSFRKEYVDEVSGEILDRGEKWVRDGRVNPTYFNIMEWCLSAPKRDSEDMEDPKWLNELYEAVVCGLEFVEQQCSVSNEDIFQRLQR